MTQTAIKNLARRLRALADKLAGADGPSDNAVAALAEGVRRLEELAASPAPGSAQAKDTAAPAPGSAQAEDTAAPPAPAAAPQAGGGSGYRIWGDGSCAPNPGVGGWGAILEHGGTREELSGASPRCTNNIMEMTAAIEALRLTPPGAEVEVTTDSQYVKNGITRWITGWKRKGWRKADGEPVLNQKLWRELDALVSERRVTWHWTRGHSGHPENERCDELANQARLAISP